MSSRRSAPDPEPLPFNPKLGQVGSWTRLPDGGVGQVWSVDKTRHRSRVTIWVADGQRYIDMKISDLREVGPTADENQMELL